MVTHFLPETNADTPHFHIKLDVRADDFAGLQRAFREALKEAKEALTDHSTGASYLAEPKRKSSNKAGRYSAHFVGEWKECAALPAAPATPEKEAAA